MRYTITTTVEVPTPQGFSEAVWRRSVFLSLRETITGSGRGTVETILMDAGDVTNVNEVDMAEVIGALELAAKVHAATGDKVMADHYLSLGQQFAHRRPVAAA